eukprot:6551300-Lingulodinium_polyedra.AAC.1
MLTLWNRVRLNSGGPRRSRLSRTTCWRRLLTRLPGALRAGELEAPTGSLGGCPASEGRVLRCFAAVAYGR